MFNIAALIIVVLGSIDHFGWRAGIPVACAIYLLTPYHPNLR